MDEEQTCELCNGDSGDSVLLEARGGLICETCLTDSSDGDDE